MNDNYLRYQLPGRPASLCFFDSAIRESIENAWDKVCHAFRIAGVPVHEHCSVYRGSETRLVEDGKEWEVVGRALEPIDPRVPVIGFGRTAEEPARASA
jgi:hypothetical protein